MHPEARLEILRRLLAASQAPEDAPPSSVPADRYRDPAVLEQERVALFRKQPLLVAHVSELPGPGDFVTEDAAGVPLLVLRDEGGHVRVFQNLCRHQGVRLVDEKQGRGRTSFRCLYHSWRYGLDGSLLDIAGRELAGAHLYPGLELRAVAHEVRYGFVWVRLDGKPDQPSPTGPAATPGATSDVAGFLGPVLDDDFTHFALASHEVYRKNVHVRACNWKLVMDALARGLSLAPDDGTYVHPNTMVVDDCAPHVRRVAARPGSLMAAPDAWNPRRDATLSYSVFPGTVLIVYPQWVSQISLFPEAVDRVRVVHRMLLTARPADDTGHERLEPSSLHVDADALASESLGMAERLQSTLGSAESRPAEHGMLFHQAWERLMSGHVK